MPRTLRHLGVLAAVTALLTTGCTAGAPKTGTASSSTASSTASMTPTEAAEPTAEPNNGVAPDAKLVRSKRDLTPVGDVVDGGHGIGVYYGLRQGDHQLFLRTIDAATGKVRWQRTAVPGEQLRLRPAVSDGEVAFVSSTSSSQGGTVTASVVDVRSGRTVTGPRQFIGKGAFEIAVCGHRRFCLDSGPWAAEVPAFGPGADTALWPAPDGWFYDQHDQVVGLKAGKETWHVPGTRIWPFAGSTNFELYPIGTADGDYVDVIEGVKQFPPRAASDIVTVGLSADDGHVLWRKMGFDALCNTITPSGDPLGHTIDTACRWTDETKPAADATTSDWADLPLVRDSFTDGTSPYDYVGFNRRTGKELWTDDSFGLPGFVTRPMSTDGKTFTAVSADDGDISSFWSLWVSDGTDGAEPPDGSTSWVAEPVDTYGTEKSSSHKLPAQMRLIPVNPGGYEGTPSWPIPQTVGVHVGSVVVVADEKGISTYRAP